MLTAEEKHQLICENCKYKFAYRQHNKCPRCKTPIDKMANPKFLHYTYYHCSRSGRPTCRQKCVSGFELERQIGAYLARIHITEKFKTYCIKYLHELNGRESATNKAIIEAQQKAYQDCIQEIDSLVGLRASPSNADGSQLSNEEYGQRRGKLLKEKAALEELLHAAGNQIEQQLKLSEQTFEFACAAQEWFAKGNAKTKKEILVTLGSNLILEDKKLIIEARAPFFILGNSISEENRENKPIEPENIGLPQGPNKPSVTMCPIVRGGRDDVRTLRHETEYLFTAVYHFFQSFKKSPYVIFPDWANRNHREN